MAEEGAEVFWSMVAAVLLVCSAVAVSAVQAVVRAIHWITVADQASRSLRMKSQVPFSV